ncbi:MAG: HEAT repeat domain-containing protein [Planctomycetes bacterium]|nr:HEAT repeat domain-containing protein [Planctomycetota bacterium]
MAARRLLPFLLLAALFGARAEEPAPPPKPSADAISSAKSAILAEATPVEARFEALQVLARAAEPSVVPALFDAAIATKAPAFAVAAGELASKLDPEAALKAYDAKPSKLRGLPLVNAVRFLGEIRTGKTGSRLAAVAASKDDDVRVEALYGIVKQGDPTLYGHLVTALKDNETAVRVPAAICCGLAKVKEAADLLVRGLEDDAGFFCFFSAWALGQIKDPDLLGRAIASTKGRMAGNVSTAKAKAINECAFDPQAHIDPLVKLAKSSNEELAAAAADALGRIGKDNPAAAEALLTLVFQAKSPVLSHLAVDALGRIGGPAEGAKILARYEQNPGNIPRHCVKALGLLATPEAAPFLLSIAYRSKESAMRKQAAIAFWQCAGRGDREDFKKKLLEATQDSALEAGCQVLGFFRAEEGFEVAVELLRKHFNKKSVRHVRDALESMTGHRFVPDPGVWRDWLKQTPGAFERKPQFLDRDAWRKQLLENKGEMGISKKTEAAVERGLDWLARHQDGNGGWSGDKFTDRCGLYYQKKCQVGARLGGWDIGMTGISLLAFYGAGYRPDQGPYKDTVLRAQVYTAARQWPDGDFGGQEDLIGGYTRPIATIAVAEAYGTTQDPEYLERARRSVAHIIRIQYDDAGWRYRLGGQFPGDTSVTGWNAWAIATGKKFGVPVDPMGLEGSNTLIEMFSSPVTEDEEFYNTDPRYFFEVGRGQEFEHFTGYNARENSRPPMTAIGLIVRIFMGRQRSHPYCIGAANRLLKSIPEYDGKTIKYTAGAEYPAYYWYYASLAMYQMGGRFWRQWSKPLLTDGIPDMQKKGDECEHGSWDCGNLDSIGGRVYTTAMCVLTLETFYRYLPALQLK